MSQRRSGGWSSTTPIERSVRPLRGEGHRTFVARHWHTRTSGCGAQCHCSRGVPHICRTGKVSGVSASTLRPRVQTLVAAGMLEQAPGIAAVSHPTGAGIYNDLPPSDEGNVNAELAYILDHLDLGSHSEVVEASAEDLLEFGDSPTQKRARLLSELRSAQLTGTGFLIGLRPGLKTPPDWVWVGR